MIDQGGGKRRSGICFSRSRTKTAKPSAAS